MRPPHSLPTLGLVWSGLVWNWLCLFFKNLQWFQGVGNIRWTFPSLVSLHPLLPRKPRAWAWPTHLPDFLGILCSSEVAFLECPSHSIYDFGVPMTVSEVKLRLTKSKLFLSRSPPKRNFAQERKEKSPIMPPPNSVAILVHVLPVGFLLRSKQGFKEWTTPLVYPSPWLFGHRGHF